jgi:hypothetical protein
MVKVEVFKTPEEARAVCEWLEEAMETIQDPRAFEVMHRLLKAANAARKVGAKVAK